MKTKFNLQNIKNIRLPFNRFFLFLGFSVALALVFVTVSLQLYKQSGSELLDLSGPKHKQIQKQVRRTAEDPTIQPTGEINQEFKQEFNRQFDQFNSKVNNQQVLLPEAMSDNTLGINVK